MNLSNPLIEIRYEGEHPTVNHMYGRNKFGRTYLKPAAKAIKSKLSRLVEREVSKRYGSDGIPDYRWYVIHLIFGVPLYYKNGNVRRWDVSDRIKLLEDGFSAGSKIDDSRHLKVHGEKVDIPHDAKPYTVIRFYGVKGENDDNGTCTASQHRG